MPTSHEYSTPEPAHRDALTWKPLRLLTFYRVILSGLLTALFFGVADRSLLGILNPLLYGTTCLTYLMFSILAGFAARLRSPGYKLQSVIQIFIDIGAITLLIHASGGPTDGLGILLIISVAAGGILLPGRIAFLFAAMATISIFSEQIYSNQVLGMSRATDYTYTGLLGVALFATASLTYLVVRRIYESEALARRRGMDIANLAKLNAHIVQRLQAGIIVTDHEHRVRLINDTARKFLHIPAVKDGVPLAELSPPLYRQLLAWRQAPDSEPALLQIDANAAGILPQFTLLGTADGIGALIFLEDTAAMAKQVQQTKLASLGRLTASIAHEIRNPLGAISHATQLLNESTALDAADQRLTTIISDHSRRMNTLIENILQLSRPGAAIPQAFTLQDWLEKFVDEFIHSGSCSAQQIKYRVEPADLLVYIDPSQLHQVVWNLCLNAVNHGSSDGMPVLLELVGGRSVSAHTVYLDIIDNGTGIDPDMSEQIFEPFFTTNTSGTGLGLYIAREICASNQARLEYRPTATGDCCFRITFVDVERLAIPALA